MLPTCPSPDPTTHLAPSSQCYPRAKPSFFSITPKYQPRYSCMKYLNSTINPLHPITHALTLLSSNSIARHYTASTARKSLLRPSLASPPPPLHHRHEDPHAAYPILYNTSPTQSLSPNAESHESREKGKRENGRKLDCAGATSIFFHRYRPGRMACMLAGCLLHRYWLARAN